MQRAKFLITGKPDSGKTAFIHSLTDSADPNYGELAVNEELVIELYAAPLDDHLSEALREKVGVVLMVDGRQSDEFADAPGIVRHLQKLRNLPLIVAVNKQDLPEAHPPNDVREQFPDNDLTTIFPCVATQKESAEKVLLALIYRMLSRNS